jgi:peptide/nickel transport system ATP-binding protein
MTHSPAPEAVLRVRDLTKLYRVTGGNGKKTDFAAVDGVSFDVHRGETYGLIGESGSGKTTIGRAVLGLIPASSGTIHLGDAEITAMSTAQLRPLRQRMQIVFQDSGSAFNPRRRVGAQVGFALKKFGLCPEREIEGRVLEMLERVGLEPSHHDRYIHEFSGGQRQRLGIARALITSPEFVVLDEPTAALDVSVQAQILNLLKDLQAERGLTMLLITHNLALVEHMCDNAGVLDHGRIVEAGPVDDLLHAPQTEITRKLVDAVLEPEQVAA